MTPSRNAPCPCGSGRKYKNCCLPKDRAVAVEEALHGAPGEAAAGHPWQAGIFPLATSIGDRPDRRVSVVLVTANGLVLHSEVVAEPLGRIDDVVDTLVDALEGTERKLGPSPREVWVRHTAVARALGVRLATRDLRVHQDHRLRDLEDAALSLSHHMLDLDVLPIMASAPTWRGWGLSAAQCRALFAAAARFRRAAPWEWIDDDPLSVFSRHGAWTAAVMGCGGEEFGLSVYTDMRDYEELYGPRATADPSFEDMYGGMITLSFEPRGELTREMQREVAGAGWEVADPDGYPRIITVNTPAGGLDPEVVEVMTGLLVAIPDFLNECADEIDEEQAGHLVHWEHQPTGLRLTYQVPGGFVWPVPERLVPGGPEGEGADPGARIEFFPEQEEDEDPHRHDPDVGLVDDFEAHLRTSVTAATATKHARNAAELVAFLRGRHGVPLRAMHEYDLRTFLFAEFPRTQPGYGKSESFPGSLRKFFAFLEERIGVRFPWAEAILADRDVLHQRLRAAPSGSWWEPDVQAFRADVWEDLDRRVMLLRGAWVDGADAGPVMGPEEGRLQEVAQRAWLVWRDELIRGGTDAPEALRAALEARVGLWLEEPDEEDGAGRTRAAVIRDERAEMPEEIRRNPPPFLS